MVNSTQLSANVTAQVDKTIVRITTAVLMFFFFSIFVYFMVIILNVFFTAPKVRETTRYILFVHMLLNDVFYLLVTFLLFLCGIFLVYIPVPICYIIFSFSACSFAITPYNLAVMSLERYTAICHPLRHAELWTTRKATVAIANMWTVGMIPQFVHFITYCFSVDKRVFNFSVICDWRSLNVNKSLEVIKTVTSFFNFSMVGLIIAYTYIRVMLVARKVNSEKFASKAGKTVLLHAFQLLLSMLSIISPFIEMQFTSSFIYLPYLDFLLFMCVPRFISPLIYGIRDEVFGKPMRRFFLTVRIQELIAKKIKF